ncbi:MAG: transcriptional regulator, MarR family [Clostridia bacterium]|jgi:DNA-binding MarR family transcriptional regulator|nr:transcriptional regulator, MarR family [Clostridia bacterium]
METDSVSQIELLLRGICFDIKQKGREILLDYDITPPQFNALQFLVNEGELTISELSNKLFLAPSTITDLIDRMEKNALVMRKKDDKDRRIVKLQVLEKGNLLINQVISRRCSYLQMILKDMPVDDMDRLIKGLEFIHVKSISF